MFEIVELRTEIARLRSTTGVVLQATSTELGPAGTYERLDHNSKSNRQVLQGLRAAPGRVELMTHATAT